MGHDEHALRALEKKPIDFVLQALDAEDKLDPADRFENSVEAGIIDEKGRAVMDRDLKFEHESWRDIDQDEVYEILWKRNEKRVETSTGDSWRQVCVRASGDMYYYDGQPTAVPINPDRKWRVKVVGYWVEVPAKEGMKAAKEGKKVLCSGVNILYDYRKEIFTCVNDCTDTPEPLDAEVAVIGHWEVWKEE